jgi:type IV pilus assembly protein PilM
MATFNTVWSIDLGKASLKAVKLRRERNNIEILAVDKIDYPVGANGVDTVQQAKEALNAFKVRQDVREPVIVAHPGQGTFSRFIKVPAFEAKKLNEMVKYEASQQIPFPLEEVIWDYHLINRDYLPGEEREVGIFAVRKEAIDDFLLDFTHEGLAVEGLSLGYLGLINYVYYDLAPQEPSIVLDIGATHTDLVLIDGKRFWIRALPHSGNDINKAIMERFKLSFHEAEKLKLESGKAQQQAVKIFSAVIQPKLKELVGEIQRSSGYYRSQAGDVKFQKLYLLGSGSKIFGIKKYLAEQLGIQVERVTTIRHFRVSRDVDLKLLQSELPAFATAFGSALQGVGAGVCRVDLIPQEEKLHKEFNRKKKHAYIAMGIVYAAIMLIGMMLGDKVKDADSKLVEHKGWIDGTITQYDPKGKSESKKSKKGAAEAAVKTAIDPDAWERSAKEIALIPSPGYLRRIALDAVRTLGEVIPPENSAVATEKGLDKEEKEILGKAADKARELNKKKVFLPYLKVERTEYPETAAAAGTPGSAREKKKGVPTVPAYKVTVFPTVTAQNDPSESMALLTKLFLDPLKKKLKDNPTLTIDSDVKVSSEVKSGDAYNRLWYSPKKGSSDSSGESSGGGRRKGTDQDITLAQKLGPFFGTEVSWFLRLDTPPKEEVVEKKAEDEEGPAKKPGKKPGKGPSKAPEE